MPLRRFTTAELVLTQRLHLERPLLVMVLLGAAALALTEGSGFYLALTAAGVLANALALLRRLEVYVPRLVVNAAVLAASVAFFFEFLGAKDVLLVLGHYLVLIQVCKLFEQKRNRDYAQMIALSVVLIVDSAMITTGMWFAGVLLAYVPVAFYVAMLLTAKVALDQQASARLTGEAGPIDPHRLAWSVSAVFPRKILWRTALGSALVSGLAAAVVFLLMPRGQPGMLVPLRPEGPAPSITGFSRSITLRDVGRITQDPRVVMEVAVSGGEEHGGPGQPLYLRGMVYDQYQNGEWREWRGELAWWSGRLPSGAPRPGGAGVIAQQVTMDPALLPALFSVVPTLEIEAPLGLTVTGAYPNLTAERVELGGEGPVRYTAYSWAQPLAARQRAYLAEVRGYAPSAPPQSASEGIARLARSWCADLLERRAAPDFRPQQRDELDLAIANRIASRLRNEYSYTLDLSAMTAEGDPAEEFLFRTRRGHCEYFASAMTLLCRSVGVQARLASGFLADHPGGPGGAYLIRARDAHAWCEVYTPSSDWAVFDATPSGALRRPASALVNLWDSAKFFWTTRIIGYGEEDRRRLFGAFLRVFETTWRGAARFFVDAGESIWNLLARGRLDANLGKGLVVLAAGLGVAALGLLMALVLRNRGRRSPALPRGAPAFYRRLLKALRRRGIRPDPSQTAREFLAAAEAALKLPPNMLPALADLFYQIRWGGLALSPAALQQAEETVAQVTGLLQARAS